MKDRLFIFFQYCLPKQFLSRCTAYLANSKIGFLKNFLIRQFVTYYNVDLNEAEYNDVTLYDNFNHFFTRSLQTGARAVDTQTNTIVSPCDGAVSQAGNIEYHQLIQAKDKQFTLLHLLANDEALAEKFVNGSFITCYLSPKDYHRVHMPCAGKLTKTIYVPGTLFSVNQTTAEHIPNLFARNERLICEFETDFGPMVYIMVGAVIVAGIETVWGGQIAPPPNTPRTEDFTKLQSIELSKGEELGRFKLGSTVILLFPEKTIQFHEELHASATLRMGEKIATLH